MAPGGASIGVALARMTRAAPVISATVSPRTRSAIRKPPICAGVASPDMITFERRFGLRLRSGLAGGERAPVAACIEAGRAHQAACPARCRGQGKEILQHRVAMLRRDALGMELHAVNVAARDGPGP